MQVLSKRDFKKGREIMSDSNGNFSNEGNADFSIWYDVQPPSQAGRIRMEFNLESFADNPHGTALVRGLMQETINEILLVIKAKRQAKAVGSILVPSGTKIPLKVQ